LRGAAHIDFIQRAGATRVAGLYQRAPLRVLLPEADDLGLKQAALLTTSGGLVGGDRLEIAVAGGEGTSALVTAQAAEKVYRSSGEPCAVRVGLSAASGAWLEWLPQETILFDGARLKRLTRIEVAATARLLAGEMLVFGRRARGEELSYGLVHDAWEVRRDGRLVWADALRLAGDVAAVCRAPACLAGAAAVATVLFVGGSAAVLDFARDLGGGGSEAGLVFAATVVGGVLIGRWLAMDALGLRQAFGRFWAAFRSHVAGLPAVLPRLWAI
jgi:urease accessory protein